MDERYAREQRRELAGRKGFCSAGDKPGERGPLEHDDYSRESSMWCSISRKRNGGFTRATKSCSTCSDAVWTVLGQMHNQRAPCDEIQATIVLAKVVSLR
jgi:hypothetical protein